MFSRILHHKVSGVANKHFGGLINKVKSKHCPSSSISTTFIGNLTRAISLQLGHRMYLTTPAPLQTSKTFGSSSTENETSSNQSQDVSSSLNQKEVSNYWTLDAEVCVIPHPEKRHKGGEDSYAISKNGKLLAVFDGTILKSKSRF